MEKYFANGVVCSKEYDFTHVGGNCGCEKRVAEVVASKSAFSDEV